MPRSALLALALLVAACRTDSTSPKGGGSFHASWIGADTGKLDDARPRAAFCEAGNRLELMAVKNDAGVGLVIYPVAEIAAGTYDAFDPEADTTRRPGVTGAARWFSEQEIAAYQSAWGTLELTRHGSTVAGKFAFGMRKLGTEDDSIMLDGRFAGVTPGPCPPDSVSSPVQGQ